MRALVLVALVALVACGSRAEPTCTCVPDHPPSTAVLDLLRRYHRAVASGGPNGRDTKLVADEIRQQTTSLCAPCGAWVEPRATVSEMYPMDRIDDATGAVCMGLVLRDGTTAYGDGRTCR